MGHVQFIFNSRKKKVDEAKPEPVSLMDLPGFKRKDGLVANDQQRAKNEYDRSIERLRLLSKKRLQKKGEEKKDLTAEIAALKDHMTNLLTRVGSYTRSQTVQGFKEENDEF